jgi:hypothetical protein
MWAKASIFRIGPFWPPRRTRARVVDDGRALTLDEPAVIDEALALGVVSASLLPGHGCRSGMDSDRALADAYQWSSS